MGFWEGAHGEKRAVAPPDADIVRLNVLKSNGKINFFTLYFKEN